MTIKLFIYFDKNLSSIHELICLRYCDAFTQAQSVRKAAR